MNVIFYHLYYSIERIRTYDKMFFLSCNNRNIQPIKFQFVISFFFVDLNDKLVKILVFNVSNVQGSTIHSCFMSICYKINLLYKDEKFIQVNKLYT